jgi:ribosome-binding factor A
MLPYKRSERVAELLREKVCRALLDIGTPASAGLITVTNVTMTDDLFEAKIYYSVLGDAEQKKAAADFLAEKLGAIRYYIGEGLTLKKVPSISLSYDETPEQAAKVFNILESISESVKPAGKAKKNSVSKRKPKKKTRK